MDLWEQWSELYRNISKDSSDEFYLRHKKQMDEGSQVLWPDALPILKLMQKRAENLKSFNKEQQNDPRNEAQIFTKEAMHFYRELPRCDYFVMYIDPAGEKKKSDYTAITVLGVSKAEAKIYVAESIVALFNRRENSAAVELSTPKGLKYYEQVLHYCVMGNLQSVLDEYCHMIDEGKHADYIVDKLNATFISATSYQIETTDSFIKCFYKIRKQEKYSD